MGRESEPPADIATPQAAAAALRSLTDKQRQVLDMLIEHKTSKEISRLLGISPHTVDQRIGTARARLGLASRGEVASTYRRLLETCGESTYQFSYMAQDAYLADSLQRDEAETPGAPGPEITPQAGHGTPERPDHRVGPELFEGQWGTLARLGAIVALAVLMAIAILGGMSIFLTLSRLSGY